MGNLMVGCILGAVNMQGIRGKQQMAKFRNSLFAGLTALGLAGAFTPASAATFSFTGNFTRDDNVQFFNFTTDGTSTVTLRTFSYAGGTNGAGQVITRGGFDPILALFDNLGNLVGQNDDGSSPDVPADPFTGRFFDTFLTALLDAGSYTVAVMQYDNFANGPTLSAGFIRAGQGNFTDTLSGGCTQGFFCDVSNVQPWDNRDGHWAFDIDGVVEADVSPVPVPAALPLMASGLAALGFVGWRRKRKADAAA